jgi:hypothetical protein
MMKVFEVELRRTSYIVLTIEAENEDEAQKKAWDEIERGDYKHEDAQWDIESVEEEAK